MVHRSQQHDQEALAWQLGVLALAAFLLVVWAAQHRRR